MGGISFIIYSGQNINIDFIKKFLSVKYRGPDDTSYSIESSVNMNTLNSQQAQQVASVLSRADIRLYTQYSFAFGYHRLAVNDMSYNATQPFEDPIMNKIIQYPDIRNRPSRKLLCNGEIYNSWDITVAENFTDRDLQSTSDVEVIMPLYIKHKDLSGDATTGLIQTIEQLNGEFAFILSENINTFVLNSINVFAVRDFLGIKPLFYVKSSESDFFMFVSEMKSLPDFVICNESYTISQVPPGSYWSFQNSIINKSQEEFIKYYDINSFKNLNTCTISSTDPDTLFSVYENMKNLITKSVIDRYKNTFQEVGILLSGGFSSSLITSIVVKHLVDTNHNFDTSPLHLFTIGDELGGEDLDVVYSKLTIDFLENKYKDINLKLHHHIVNVNEIEILSKDVDKIIYHLETYEPETVRDSIPYFYLFNYIKTFTNIKVLLSGDGLNDTCGYEEFQSLSDEKFQSVSVELLSNLAHHDILRTDRISSGFSLELRQPFLDKSFIEFMLSLHPKLKRHQVYKESEAPIDKYIIRKSFDDNNNEEIYLPDEILWRKYRCICESLTNFEVRLDYYFSNFMTDEEYNVRLESILLSQNCNQLTLPKTKEEMFYRLSFDNLFPNRSSMITRFWSDLWK